MINDDQTLFFQDPSSISYFPWNKCKKTRKSAEITFEVTSNADEVPPVALIQLTIR